MRARERRNRDSRVVCSQIDVDESGDLEKAEIIDAVKNNQKVIKFLINCGNKNLQYLLVPARLEAALAVLDTDRDGHIDMVEWRASEFYNLGRRRRGRRGDGVLVA